MIATSAVLSCCCVSLHHCEAKETFPRVPQPGLTQKSLLLLLYVPELYLSIYLVAGHHASKDKLQQYAASQ